MLIIFKNLKIHTFLYKHFHNSSILYIKYIEGFDMCTKIPSYPSFIKNYYKIMLKREDLNSRSYIILF